MTAPERIWIADHNHPDGTREYIRADLAAVPAQVLDMIRREDAIECFMGLDRIGDIKDAIAALEPQPDQSIEIDIRAVMMDEIEKAASESPWVPKEYYMNDIISDCCAFLRDDRIPQPDPRDEVIAQLVEALADLRHNIGCAALVKNPAGIRVRATADAALAAAKAVQHG